MDSERINLWAAIILSVLVKWALSEDPALKDPTPQQKARRLRRSLGGILAGILIAYFGNEPLIRWVPLFSADDRIVVAIMLALTGEHITRWLIGIGPEFFNILAKRFLGERS